MNNDKILVVSTVELCLVRVVVCVSASNRAFVARSSKCIPVIDANTSFE